MSGERRKRGLVAKMRITSRNDQLEIATPAKVNLFLELLKRRDDGFHEIETVMSGIALYDHLKFSVREDPAIRLNIRYATQGNQPCEQDDIPADDRNLICKTISLVRSIAASEGNGDSCSQGIAVELLKNIPSAAGLGGASSNAAAALVAANSIWSLNWSKARLVDIAAQLGSDIPFFLTGGTAICRGRGEIIEPMIAPSRVFVVIAKPEDAFSTAQVFSQVKLNPDSKLRQIKSSTAMSRGLQAGLAPVIGKQLFNRLQEFARPLSSQISKMEFEFNRLNCLGHQMSGSGSSYFGLFMNSKTARQAANSLSSRLQNVRIFCTHTLGQTRTPSPLAE